ncbi:hypothetical protein OS189_05375 [Sulfitobacter sp. F26169L]|uniref:hypothetical protein n=1 Tax=Sulfitobacter sp. F26169L TaxID=2996015 RepID=UPI0022608F53|nr:hypothetical protein [Sulfitobacter sp. F26169L]MCX7565765.1 hypothetical protein [Sulfitobacter sp. F26169L]
MDQWKVRSGNGAYGIFRKILDAAIGIVSRCPDVFIAVWMLDAMDLSIYLVARMLSLSVPAALSVLEWKITPRLLQLLEANKSIAFCAAAARVNLSYMMIAGAIGLLVVSGMTFLMHEFSIVNHGFEDAFLWMVVGQSSPVLFGATALLMKVFGREVVYTLFSHLTWVFFALCMLILKVDGPVQIAQLLATAQLTLAGVCAALLTQNGVWPGLTAVFHKKIRIF